MMQYIILLRPLHWIKNFFLFAAPLFAGSLFRYENLLTAFLSFAAFSLCSSAVYILNDLADEKTDRFHPQKNRRPIAAGTVSRHSAQVLSLLLFFSSIIAAYCTSLLFLPFLFVYFAIQIIYSFHGKKVPFLDVVLIASGFLIRMQAGAAAFLVTVSNWLFICLFCLAMVLATGKRYSEAILLQHTAPQHRKVFLTYSPKVLLILFVFSCAASAMFYTLYAVAHPQYLITVPLVLMGLVRYSWLTSRNRGEPVSAIIHDRFLCTTVIIWLAVIIATT